MGRLDALRERIPDAAKDIRVNVQNVLGPAGGGVLSPAQRGGVAIACAIASRNAELAQAVLDDLAESAGPAAVEDARAAAALMAMNNVYYRFKHMVGKPVYAQKPARLRMQRIAQVVGPKADFELFCLAVSAVNGCESCVRSHEEAVLTGGLTEDHVNDAVRVAATVQAAAVAIEMGALKAAQPAAPERQAS